MSARLDVLAPHLIAHLLAMPDRADMQRVARILARGEQRQVAPVDVDRALLAWFGLASFEGVAGITAAMDLATPDADRDWLRADPVHLRADATRVILFNADSVGVSAADSDALLAVLNAGFAEQGLRFERGDAPTRWYVRGAAPVVLDLASPRSLHGSAVEDNLDALRRAGALNRALTEAQMLLYGAPLNEARAAAGHAPINSVWFWGGGPMPAIDAGTRAAVVGDDDLLGACARHAGIAHHRDGRMLDEVLRGTRGDVLLLDHADPGGWQPGRFADEVLGPASVALARGRLAEVVVHAGEREFSLTRGARWRWWRRPAALIETLRKASL